jgi:hypothetical protein
MLSARHDTDNHHTALPSSTCCADRAHRSVVPDPTEQRIGVAAADSSGQAPVVGLQVDVTARAAAHAQWPSMSASQTLLLLILPEQRLRR